jgi:hypothetical protein
MKLGFDGAKSKVPILAMTAGRVSKNKGLRLKQNRAYDASPISREGRP